MYKERKLTVIDLEPGIGGRAAVFSSLGCDVLAVESDHTFRDLFHSLHPHIHLIEIPAGDVTAKNIPKPDILVSFIANRDVNPSHAAHQKIPAPIQRLTSTLIYDRPLAFLLQVSSSIVLKNIQKWLFTPILRQYAITYSGYKNADFSGFPVGGNQFFIIGIRNDLFSGRFYFPEIPAGLYRDPIFEHYSTIDPWYRTLPRSFRPPENEGKPFYFFDLHGRTIGSDQIRINMPSRCIILDPHGYRRLTHNEAAWLKGYEGDLFDRWSNKRKMYETLSSAPNLYVLYPVAKALVEYLQNAAAIFQAEKGQDDPGRPLPKKKKPAAEPFPSPSSPIIMPRTRLTNIHIDKLKCLANLDIPIQKNLTAIMGVNGIGKSTILHALACIYAPVKNGEDHKFNFFFTPTPDASWQNSSFSIKYYDENSQGEVERLYQKKSDRWSPRYDRRPKRDTFYIGIDSCLPEIELERQVTFIDYLTNDSTDSLSGRIIQAASNILNKDYTRLTTHKTKKKVLFGVHTPQITYSSLSMGAGEQRLIRILTTVYHAMPYSLILIDEIDLLLHADAQKKLIGELSAVAARKHLQIIFTTHSMEIGKLTDLVDIRYLYNTNEKTMVYDRITPDIVYDLNREQEQPLVIYVEDDLAQAVISCVASKLNLRRYTRIEIIGSAQNAFTLAAGMVIEGTPLDNVLIVLDGDVHTTEEEKQKQIKKVLSGTEEDHDEKVSCALSVIRQLSLPESVPPEKFIHSILIDMEEDSELTKCAKCINTVSDNHDWLNEIIRRIGQNREVVLYQCMEQISGRPEWNVYVDQVRSWLLEKKAEVIDQPCLC